MKSMMAGVLSLWLAPPCRLLQQGIKLRFVLAPSPSQTPCGAEWKNESRLLSISLIVDRGSMTDARARDVTCLVEVTCCTAQQQELQKTYRIAQICIEVTSRGKAHEQIDLFIKMRRFLSSCERSAVKIYWAPLRWSVFGGEQDLARVQTREPQSRS